MGPVWPMHPQIGSGFAGWVKRRQSTIEGLANNPFFSPNGEWVGFFSEGNGTGLKKVPVLGGTPVPIVANIRAARRRNLARGWHDRVRNQRGPVSGVRERWSAAAPGETGSPAKGTRYAWPQFMPDGRSVLFTMVPEDSIEGAQIAVLDVKTLEARIVLKGGSAARYTSTGHLVYASGQTLKAIAFDPETRQTRGDPVSLPDIEIATTPDNGAADFAVSETGTLLFLTPHVPGQLCGRCRGSTVRERKNPWRSRRGNMQTRASHRTELAWLSTLSAPIGISGYGTSSGRA